VSSQLIALFSRPSTRTLVVVASLCLLGVLLAAAPSLAGWFHG
jgi:hypothetical protein